MRLFYPAAANLEETYHIRFSDGLNVLRYPLRQSTQSRIAAKPSFV